MYDKVHSEKKELRHINTERRCLIFTEIWVAVHFKRWQVPTQIWTLKKRLAK